MAARKPRRSARRPQWGMHLTPTRSALIQEAERIVTALCGGKPMSTSAAVEIALRAGVTELQRKLAAGESFF